MTVNNPNGNYSNGVIAQSVEAERSPLRWLWWLVGVLLLGLIAWAIFWGCSRGAVVEEPIDDVVTEVVVPAEPETAVTLPAELDNGTDDDDADGED